MLHIFENEHFLGLIYLHDAVELPFIIVLVSVEVGSEGNLIEKEVQRQGRQLLLGDVLLEKRLQKGPKDYLLDDAVDSACFLLVFEETHLTCIHAQSQLSRVHHPNPTEITTLQVILRNQN